nr:hypothetical protein [Tanacetum cinerariifolium]
MDIKKKDKIKAKTGQNQAGNEKRGKVNQVKDRVSEIKNAVGNKQYKPDDVQELFRKLLNDVQNIHEELADYINIPSWNHPAFSSHDDDDENYTISITPEEPDNSLNQFKEFFDSNDDSTSIDDDYFSIDNIDYVEASPPDSELISLEEVKDDNLHEKLMNINLLIAKIKSLNDNPIPDHVLKSLSPFPIPVEDSDSFLEKSDTSLSYSDNSLLEFETFSNHTEETNTGKPRVYVPNILTTHPTLILDLDFIPSDNSLPKSKILYFDIEEKNSGSTTIHADISISDLECFNFEREPEPGELTSIVDSEIRENVPSATNVNLPPEDDHFPLFAYVVWIFLSFLTYPVVPPYLLSFGNEDTIFDPGITNYHFPSLLPDVSHRCGIFMKFNVYPNHLNESPMEILSSTTFPKVMDIKEKDKIEAKIEQNQAGNEKRGKFNQVKEKVKVKPGKPGHEFGKSTKN